MKEMPQYGRTVTIAEFARIWGVSSRTISTRIKDGRIKALKLGGVGQRRIPVTEIPDVLRVDDRETIGQRRKRVEKARATMKV